MLSSSAKAVNQRLWLSHCAHEPARPAPRNRPLIDQKDLPINENFSEASNGKKSAQEKEVVSKYAKS
jgi:hypothetical protein